VPVRIEPLLVAQLDSGKGEYASCIGASTFWPARAVTLQQRREDTQREVHSRAAVADLCAPETTVAHHRSR